MIYYNIRMQGLTICSHFCHSCSDVKIVHVLRVSVIRSTACSALSEYKCTYVRTYVRTYACGYYVLFTLRNAVITSVSTAEGVM